MCLAPLLLLFLPVLLQWENNKTRLLEGRIMAVRSRGGGRTQNVGGQNNIREIINNNNSTLLFLFLAFRSELLVRAAAESAAHLSWRKQRFAHDTVGK